VDEITKKCLDFQVFQSRNLAAAPEADWAVKEEEEV